MEEKKREQQFSKESIYCGLAVIIGMLLYINEVNSFLGFILSGVAYFFVVLVLFKIGASFTDILGDNRASSTVVYYLKLVALIFVIVTVTFAIISAAFGSTTKTQKRRAEEQQELIAAEREEAFTQGADKAVKCIQENIEANYSTGEWYYLNVDEFVREYREDGGRISDDNVELLYFISDYYNNMYFALQDVMDYDGAELVDWQIELDD